MVLYMYTMVRYGEGPGTALAHFGVSVYHSGDLASKLTEIRCTTYYITNTSGCSFFIKHLDQVSPYLEGLGDPWGNCLFGGVGDPMGNCLF